MLTRLIGLLGPCFLPDPDPLPPTTGDPSPSPVPPESRREREERAPCEFCECVLTRRGEVLKLSDKARKYRDQSESLTKAERECARLTEENAALRARLKEIETPATRPSGTRGMVPSFTG